MYPKRQLPSLYNLSHILPTLNWAGSGEGIFIFHQWRSQSPMELLSQSGG